MRRDLRNFRSWSLTLNSGLVESVVTSEVLSEDFSPCLLTPMVASMDQENIVAALFDAGDNLGDLFGIGERLVDGFAEFLHELFELLVHWVPRSLSRTEPDAGT